VHTLTGHTNTVATVRCQAAEPQIITGNHIFYKLENDSIVCNSFRKTVFTLKPQLISCRPVNPRLISDAFCRQPRLNHQTVGSDCWKNQSDSDKPQEVCPNSGDAPQTVSQHIRCCVWHENTGLFPTKRWKPNCCPNDRLERTLETSRDLLFRK